MDTKAELLAAIYTAFTEAGKVRDDDFLSTQALLSALKKDFAWAGDAFLAKASRTLSKFLGQFGIRSVRKGRVRVRGYRRGQFREVWAKYVTLPQDDPVYPVTSASEADSSRPGPTERTGPGTEPTCPDDLGDPADFLGRTDPTLGRDGSEHKPVPDKEPGLPKTASEAELDEWTGRTRSTQNPLIPDLGVGGVESSGPPTGQDGPAGPASKRPQDGANGTGQEFRTPTVKVRITAGYPFCLFEFEDGGTKPLMKLYPGDRVELPRRVADDLIAAGMAEELPPTAKVRRRRKYHLGTPEDRFIGAVLYALGFTEAEIARVLDKDRATISRWKRQPVSVPEGWGKRGRWKSWEAFRSAFGPPTPLAVACTLAEEPFARAVRGALQRESVNESLTVYSRLVDTVLIGVGAAVLHLLPRFPCPRCRQAIRPLDRVRVVLLHEACFRQTWPNAWALPVRPCL